ncbi:hypothetical protein B0T25DRAFT_477211 [Lasiosphaeria hispida]|uniref:Ankyrin repeat protein n=1 Tax=Lasiosphaeria hispida TaxID=260671 RepID=A0AAJ0HNC9_9PEZI|nr:hypothetical protein B0T25DRAFT_477211 [Lasiosphaeria hispida]
MFLYIMSFLFWSGKAVADDGDDFSNNLFTDLAPLLALFGEQFCKQFMSQSMGWLDHVLFAMGPLGILTALVSAIRVGGHPWLKAIIGRARENRAAVEIELMSSTSHEVCEVWNGEGIVRSLGKPGIRQIIYLECDKDSEETLGLHTISTALEAGLLKDQTLTPKPAIRSHPHPNAKSRKGLNPAEVAAPNISLNIHGGSKYGELLAGAIFGSICQFGVLIFTGFSVYHPTFSAKFLKDAEEVPRYGYPIMALGTVMLTIGMILCSYVIDSSTQETKFILQSAQPDTPKQTIRTLWLQKSHTLSDQDFNSFVLFSPVSRTYILSSERAPDLPKAPNWKDILGVLTLLGVALGLTGYVLQFQGLRALNWTASISQLVCLALMTLLRAWVRRGLIAKPVAKRVLEDHEMDYLHMQRELPKYPTSSSNDPKTPGTDVRVTSPSSTDSLDGPAARALAVRRRLGRITLLPGLASGLAIAIADSVEAVMASHSLFEDASNAFIHKYQTFSWALEVNLGPTRTPGRVRFSVDRKRGTWKMDPSKVDAALSLWLYHCHRMEDRNSTDRSNADWLRQEKSSRRMISRVVASSDISQIRDMKWWMGDMIENVPSAAGKGKATQQQLDPLKSVTVIGFRGLEESQQGRLGNFGHRDTSDPGTTTTILSLEAALAQHIFMSFMWAIVKSVSAVKLEQNSTTSVTRPENFRVDEPETILTLRLENDVLGGLSSTISQSGLGTIEDAYACIIPPLSHLQKLPNKAVVTFVRQRLRDQERLTNWDAWKTVVTMYRELFRALRPHSQGAGGSIGNIGAILVHLCWALACNKVQKENQKRTDGLEQMGDLITDLVHVLDRPCSQQGLPISTVLEEFRRLYHAGQDFDEVEIPVPDNGADKEESRSDDWSHMHQRDSDERRRALGRLLAHPHVFQKIDETRERNAHRKIKADLNVRMRDLFDWTPLHYSAARGNLYAVQRLLRLNANPNVTDLAGWTPLHYAVQAAKTAEGSSSAISIIRELQHYGASADLGGRDGICALHCAARKATGELTDVLLQGGASVDLQDNSGMTALHWAAYSRLAEPVKALLRRGAYRAARDEYDRTPLHLAALRGCGSPREGLPDTVASLLAADNTGEVRAIDRDGRTPLHLAAMQCNSTETAVLLRYSSSGPTSELMSEDNDSCTPLDIAIIYSPDKTAPLILQKLELDGIANMEVPLTTAIIFGRHSLIERISKMVADEGLIRGLLKSVKTVRDVVGRMGDYPMDYFEYAVAVIVNAPECPPARRKFYISRCKEVIKSQSRHYGSLCETRAILHKSLGGTGGNMTEDEVD